MEDHADYSKLNDIYKAAPYKERRYQTQPDSSTEDEDRENNPGKQGNTINNIRYLLLYRSLLSSTCVLLSMVMVVVGLQQDVMEGTVVGVVGVVVEVELIQGLEEWQIVLGDLE